MANEQRPGWRPGRQSLAASVILTTLVVVGYALLANRSVSPVAVVSSASPGSTTAATQALPVPSAGPSSIPTAEPTPGPSFSADVVDPLTGLLVDARAAQYHPVAVMVDDQQDARPQSGFNAASVVIQAPAEGGIPRYMLVFQQQIPASVGPIRSARQYFVEWAAGWNAMYVHHGGSPQALATLAASGHGQLVWNADGFRWSPTYLWRIPQRAAPHNVYTDGKHLRALERRIGVPDEPIAADWTFETTDGTVRPLSNTITVVYPAESVRFVYDAGRNVYLRYIAGSKKAQRDAADGNLVTPTNVVVVRMHFGPLLNSNPKKKRLEAADVGTGDAWISTGGRSIHGTWRKAAVDAPLLFFDEAGQPVALQPGQTFIEVITLDDAYSIRQGVLPHPADRDLGGPATPR